MSLVLNNAEALVKIQSMDTAALVSLFGEKPAITGPVVGALYNADTDGMLNTLLHNNPAGVITGLKIATMLHGTDSAVLVVNTNVNEQEIQANANMAGLTLTITQADTVAKTNYRQSVFYSLAELASMSVKLMGQEPGLLIAIDDEVAAEMQPDTKVASIVPEGIQGIVADHVFYAAAALADLTVAEAAPKSGVIHTIPADGCPVDALKKEVAVLKKKSCGRCTFCREGLYQHQEILDAVVNGRAKQSDLDLAAEIADVLAITTNCTLGEAAGLPVLSAMKAFPEEVQAHVRSKKCSAGVCAALVQYYIDPAMCKGSGACMNVCPVGAIEGKPGYISMVDPFSCTRCGLCIDACELGAVKKTSGRLPKLPSRLTKVKGAKIAAAAEAKEEVKVKAKRKRSFAKLTPAAPVAEEAAPAAVAAPKPEVKIMRTIETDVVIVAGGPAGLATAIAAGEAGYKTVIIEKSGATGGAANMGMGPLGIDTKIQRANFNNISVKEALGLHMEYTHWRVDADLVQTYFNKSADTIEWLEDMGVEFAGSFRYFKESAATWHIVKPENGVIGPRAAGAMIKAMTERAKSQGCEILLETAGQSLITEDGKVCGVVAVDKEGNGIEVRGKAVCVATGGFGNNKEMIKKEFGLNLGEDFFPFMIPGITGDGLRMMWEVGADKFMPNIEAIYQIPDNLNWFLLDAVLRQPNLLINQKGDRFMNEGMMGNTTFTGNAIAMQPGNYAYCIMDEGILKEYKKNGPDIVDIVHPADAFLAFDGQAALAVEQNYVGYIEAETVEELAEKLGIDAEKLQETIDEYNEMCECGVDSKFHKQQEYLHPITGRGKYLVGKYYLAAYGTVGGVRINKYCEVLDKDQNVIEGLYSAGSDANTIYGDSYNFTLPGNTMGFAVNSGRMAGESIAAYLDSLSE